MPDDAMDASTRIDADAQRASALLISGVRGVVRQRQDEVLVAHVEIEPRHVPDFWRKFPEVGSCVALAPLAGDDAESASGEFAGDAISLDTTRGGVRQRMDGTLVVYLEVKPEDVLAFWRLFPKVSSGVALAPLLQPFRRPRVDSTQGSNVDRHGPVGGSLARLAAMLCKQEEFWSFLRGLPGYAHVRGETDAVAAIYALCGIPSRALLDSDARAGRIFHEVIRRPYVEYARCEILA